MKRASCPESTCPYMDLTMSNRHDDKFFFISDEIHSILCWSEHFDDSAFELCSTGTPHTLIVHVYLPVLCTVMSDSAMNSTNLQYDEIIFLPEIDMNNVETTLKTRCTSNWKECWDLRIFFKLLLDVLEYSRIPTKPFRISKLLIELSANVTFYGSFVVNLAETCQLLDKNCQFCISEQDAVWKIELSAQPSSTAQPKV